MKWAKKRSQGGTYKEAHTKGMKLCGIYERPTTKTIS